MAAGLGFKTFTTGEVLTATDTNGYLMQGVLVFASSAARSAAITSPEEGQYSYLKDTNSTEYYDGAAWIAAPIGDITGVTAGTGISGGGTSGTVTITNSMATEITAKGDLIVGTGSATFDNLPVGTNGMTIVADSTASTGLKWATPASGSTFVGCSLTKSAAQSIPNATETVVTFNTEPIDTDGFHTGTDGKITIPAGKAGKYLVTAQIMSDSATFQTQGGMRKNGTGVFTYYAPKSPTAPCVLINTILTLAVADYLEIYVYQGSGTAKDVLANSYTASATVFSATYLGA